MSLLRGECCSADRRGERASETHGRALDLRYLTVRQHDTINTTRSRRASHWTDLGRGRAALAERRRCGSNQRTHCVRGSSVAGAGEGKGRIDWERGDLDGMGRARPRQPVQRESSLLRPFDTLTDRVRRASQWSSRKKWVTTWISCIFTLAVVSFARSVETASTDRC